MTVCEHCGSPLSENAAHLSRQLLQAFQPQQRRTYEQSASQPLPAVLCARCLSETIGAVNTTLAGGKA